MQSKPKLWHCPLCSYPGVPVEVMVPYGETCPFKGGFCPHAQENGLHITGRFYANAVLTDDSGLGLSEIANAEEQDG